MARMVPARPSPDAPASEETVFRALADALDDDWTILARARWFARDGARGPVCACEADFLLAHPRRGILVLEVKGGGIRFDPASGVWSSVDRGGVAHTLGRAPLEQAMVTSKRLLQTLRESSAFRMSVEERHLMVGYAVALPDCRVDGIALPASLPGKLVIDRAALARIGPALEEAFEDHGAAPPAWLDPRWIDDLVRLLAPRVEIPAEETRFRVPARLRGTITAAEREFVRLSEEQLRVLDGLARRKRVLITGCAGSGKTFLAVEHARRLAAQGLSVLVVCFNKLLASRLREALAGHGGAEAMTFHDLCALFVREAGVKCAGAPESDDSSARAYYEVTLPNAFDEAIGRVERRWDALIVDEGQDFQALWWVALPRVLRAEREGIFLVFHDDGQAIFTDKADLPALEHRMTLTSNLRNTRRVHECVRRFSAAAGETPAFGPEGRAVEVLTYAEDGALPGELSRVLHRLTVEEKVAVRDVAVLTYRRLRNTPLHEGRAGKFVLTLEPSANECEVFTTTIHAFKGLESPVVVLAGMEDSPRLTDGLLYVGASRARHHLVALCRKGCEGRFGG